MPLQTNDTMLVDRLNRFDGLVSWINSCHTEIRRQVFNTLTMD